MYVDESKKIASAGRGFHCEIISHWRGRAIDYSARCMWTANRRCVLAYYASSLLSVLLLLIRICFTLLLVGAAAAVGTFFFALLVVLCS